MKLKFILTGFVPLKSTGDTVSLDNIDPNNTSVETVKRTLYKNWDRQGMLRQACVHAVTILNKKVQLFSNYYYFMLFFVFIL